MVIVAILLSACTTTLAALHLAWAFGLWLPYREELPLVRAVVGIKNTERMPGPIPCGLISGGLLLAAIVPWWPGLGWLGNAIACCAGVTFLLRGALAYVSGWRRVATVEPFRTLDRRVYGPVGLLLGLGYLAVALT